MISVRNWEDIQEFTDKMITEDILNLPELVDDKTDSINPCSLIHRCAQVGEEQIFEHIIKIYIKTYVEHSIQTTYMNLDTP